MRTLAFVIAIGAVGCASSGTAADGRDPGASPGSPRDAGGAASGPDGQVGDPTGNAEAGGGGGDDAPGSDGTPDSGLQWKQCFGAAAEICARLGSCSPFAMKYVYGTPAMCGKRWQYSFCSQLDLPNSSATLGDVLACGLSISGLTCDEVLAQHLGPACVAKPGALANGAPCGDDSQCTSTFCSLPATSLCGTCAPLTNVGDPCVNQACSSGLVCSQSTTKCVALAAGKLGDPCTGQEQCNLALGIGCDPISQKCINFQVVGPGGACGPDSLTAPTVIGVCGAGGVCSSQTIGTCLAAAADGAPCTVNGSTSNCLAPAVCTGGTCQLPDPRSCK